MRLFAIAAALVVTAAAVAPASADWHHHGPHHRHCGFRHGHRRCW